jgi:chromosome segregation ATPase
MRLVMVCTLALMLPGLAAAAMPDTLQIRVETLARESDGLVKQRHKWDSVQQALLAQKQQIEATQKEVLQDQDSFNQRAVNHDQQVAAQQQTLKAKQSDCGNDSGNTTSHVNDCDNDAKKLNQKSGDLNTDVTALQTEQAKLNAKYAQANQSASDWNAHESVATDHLNEVYRATNDWLDRAYTVIIDEDFRDAVTATGADAYCENRGLPADRLSIPTLIRLSDGYRKCLKYVLSAEQKAAVPAATTH